MGLSNDRVGGGFEVIVADCLETEGKARGKLGRQLIAKVTTSYVYLQIRMNSSNGAIYCSLVFSKKFRSP